MFWRTWEWGYRGEPSEEFEKELKDGRAGKG